MKFLPVFLAIEGKKCLVVGAGSIAARKAELLHKAGGKLCVVAPDISVAVRDLAFVQEIELLQRVFVESDLENAFCVIAATDDKDQNRDISRLAQARGIAVNVVDNPEMCSFIMSSIIERGPIQIAISTGGASPVLARMLRSRLESTIPGAYGELATLAEEFRLTVKQTLPDVDARRRFWESILDGQVADQAALYGVLLRIRDLGIPLLSVNETDPTPLSEEGR